MKSRMEVELWVAGDRRGRYPEGTVLGADGGAVRFVGPGAADQPPQVVVVDRPGEGELSALARAPGALLSLGSLAALDAAGLSGTLEARPWLPLTPLAVAADVLEAQRAFSGQIGRPCLLDVTTSFGGLREMAWEEDAFVALEPHEAATFGMQLIELLCEAPLEESWVIDRQDEYLLCGHHLARCSAIQRVVPAGLLRSPLFKAEAHCMAGRLLLRDEFALGPLGVGTPDGNLGFSAVPTSKPGVQAPDTLRGGLELLRLLERLVHPSAGDELLRVQARQLSARATELLGSVRASPNSAKQVDEAN